MGLVLVREPGGNLCQVRIAFDIGVILDAAIFPMILCTPTR